MSARQERSIQLTDGGDNLYANASLHYGQKLEFLQLNLDLDLSQVNHGSRDVSHAYSSGMLTQYSNLETRVSGALSAYGSVYRWMY